MLASALSSYLLKYHKYTVMWHQKLTQNYNVRKLAIFSGKIVKNLSSNHGICYLAYIVGFTPSFLFQERSNSWLYLHVRVLIGADFRSVGHFHTFLFHKRTINILLIDVLDHWLIVIAAQILKQHNFLTTWHLSKLQFDLHCCNHRSWPWVSSRYLRRPFWQCLQCCQPWCSLAFENWSLNTTCVICVVGVTV